MNDVRVNIIGGNAYSTTGGIQAVNKFLVEELSRGGMLRNAFFLWDSPETVSPDGKKMHSAGILKFYKSNRCLFILDIIKQKLRRPRDLWLCTHVNYASIAYLINFIHPKRMAVFLYAAELDVGFSWLKRFGTSRSGRVFAISNYTKIKAVKVGIPPSLIRVLPIGVSKSYHCVDKMRDVEGSRILFVGRMDERYKGQLELIDAMQILRRRFPRLRLVFIGGGKTLPEWRSEAERRDLAEIVEFRGQVSDLELIKAYRCATLFAMPSENEGFGLVYVEAMAFALPCIGGDTDAAKEVIVDGVTGYCVPPRNSTVLAGVIAKLLRSPSLVESMGKAGERRFQELFVYQKYRERVLSAIIEWRNAAA